MIVLSGTSPLRESCDQTASAIGNRRLHVAMKSGISRWEGSGRVPFQAANALPGSSQKSNVIGMAFAYPRALR
jgi:hypothetical protein